MATKTPTTKRLPALPQSTVSERSHTPLSTTSSKKSRVSSFLSSCSSIFSRSSKRSLSSRATSPPLTIDSISKPMRYGSSTPLWEIPPAPHESCRNASMRARPRRATRPPSPYIAGGATYRQHRQAVSSQQKRMVLLNTIAKGNGLPESTMQGVRYILAQVVPDVYLARSSLYVDIDDLPPPVIDELYTWMTGRQI